MIPGPSEEVAIEVARFRKAANEKGTFASPPSHDHALADQMDDAWHRLGALGKDGVAARESLLRDSSAHVRKWVAAQLACEGHPDARAVIVELTKEPGLDGFGARVTLRLLDEGRPNAPFGWPEGVDRPSQDHGV